jgi:hypothetical protein
MVEKGTFFIDIEQAVVVCLFNFNERNIGTILISKSNHLNGQLLVVLLDPSDCFLDLMCHDRISRQSSCEIEDSGMLLSSSCYDNHDTSGIHQGPRIDMLLERGDTVSCLTVFTTDHEIPMQSTVICFHDRGKEHVRFVKIFGKVQSIRSRYSDAGYRKHTL